MSKGFGNCCADIYPSVVLVHLSQDQQQNKEQEAEADHSSRALRGPRRFMSTQTACGEK